MTLVYFGHHPSINLFFGNVLGPQRKIQELSVAMMNQVFVLICCYATSYWPRMYLINRTSLPKFQAGSQSPKIYILTFLSYLSPQIFQPPISYPPSPFILSCWCSPHDGRIFRTCVRLTALEVKMTLWVYSIVFAYQIGYHKD